VFKSVSVIRAELLKRRNANRESIGHGKRVGAPIAGFECTKVGKMQHSYKVAQAE
jgi:hypothetical protein